MCDCRSRVIIELEKSELEGRLRVLFMLHTKYATLPE
jgi:hypothetical protein